MLTIRVEQMNALVKDRLRRFEDQAVAHVQSNFPDEFAGRTEADVREGVRTAIAKAQSYGIGGERDLLRFLHAMYALGPDFDSRCGWAREILEDTELEPHSKTEELLYRAVANGVAVDERR